jgi:hypothetical protein
MPDKRTAPVAESLLGPVTDDVPISYGQNFAKQERQSAKIFSSSLLPILQ